MTTQLTGLTSSMWIYTLMSAIAAAAAALAPALALRRPTRGAMLAFQPSIPLWLFMYSPGLPLRLATFTALPGVATSAMNHSIRRGWVFGAVALIVPAAFTFWSGTTLWTAGTSGMVRSEYWNIK